MSLILPAKRPHPSIKRENGKTPISIKHEDQWVPLLIHPDELRLEATLMSGQSFRWLKTGESEWSSVIQITVQSSDDSAPTAHSHGFIQLRETSSDVLFKIVSTRGQHVKIDAWERRLREYLRIDDIQLREVTGAWAEKCQHYRRKLAILPGLRLLKVDRLESFVAFMSSSQNSVKRLTLMLSRLCRHFSNNLVGALHVPSGFPKTKKKVEAGASNASGASKLVEFYSFPSLPELLSLSEDDWTHLGFGYRASYLIQSLPHLHSLGGEYWLLELSKKTHGEAREALQSFCGIGPKVADCVCLFSFGMETSVPVDTHCWQFSCRDYFPHWGALVDYFGWKCDRKQYGSIGLVLKEIFGHRVGWAFMVLFAGTSLPQTVVSSTT